jgi:hypothetical protein
VIGNTTQEEHPMDRGIPQEEWTAFFDDFIKTHHGYEVRLEIVGHTFGDQEEAAWLPFTGISYDRHHQQLFITVGGLSSRFPVHLTHMIQAPEKVQMHLSPAGEELTMRIMTPDPTETLVHLRPQRQLTA